MEASSSQITSPSPPSSNLPCKYDVFLSFRGPDTRKGIISNLYNRLQSSGIKTFMDDPDLQVGDAISRTLIEAIEGSRFAIVALSRDYASSAWCLEELAKICECMEDQNRILPLFYHVEPTDVRYQKRSFEEAFSNHENSGRHDLQKVKQWRDALNKVATFSGWNTNDHKTHEKLIDVIVEALRSKLALEAFESIGDFQAFRATKQAMDEVQKALKDDEVTAVGVYGMGGVGKTALVEYIGVQARKNGMFNHVTKVVISQNPDYEKLQQALAEQLGFEVNEKTEIGRAARVSKEIMRKRKILIILDDIWGRMEVSRIGIPSYKQLLECNSKVLLTTRIWNVCHVMECQRKITLTILSEEDSWALFKRKARMSFKSPTLESVAKKVARECKGLPIALIAVARALGDKELVEWERACQQLEKSQSANPDDCGEASKCIKLSYDYLENDEYKSYFLLCCLFPENSDIPVEVLFRYAIGHGLFQDVETLGEARERSDSAARHLKSSSLLLDNQNNEYVRMHDVVRDAAIQIAQKNGFLVKPHCSLVDWPRKLHESCSVISLTGNHIRRLPEKLVCPKLQILLLDMNLCLEEIPETFFQSAKELTVLDLSWTRLSLLPQSFSLLTNLKVLSLVIYLIVDVIIGTSILGKLKNLEILSMRKLSTEIGGLTNLRLLDITGSYIARIPAKVISKLHNLEELYMPGFWDWGKRAEGEGEEINAGFDEVTSLPKLRVLRVTLSNAECLPKDVEFNPKWVEFDICIGRKRHVNEMKLYNLNTSVAQENSDRVIRLELDSISGLPEWFCNEIMELAKRIRRDGYTGRLIDIIVESQDGRLQGLKQLDIQGPKQVTDIPRLDIEFVKEERRLFQDSKLRRSLQDIPRLDIDVDKPEWKLFQDSEPRRSLQDESRRLQEYEQVLARVNKLNTMTLVPKKPVFENLEELKLSGLDCKKFCDVELARGSLFNLKSLEVEDCYNWGSILLPSTLLPRLPNLEKLQCKNMEEIVYVFSYEALLVLKQIKLREMVLYGLATVSLPAPPATFQNLQSLSISYCKRLRGSLFSYDVAQCLSQLNSLVLDGCPSLERIVEENNKKIILPKLKQLTLNYLPGLYYQSATFDIQCPSLEELSIKGCRKLHGSLLTYDVAGCLSQLNRLVLYNCPLLERIVEASNKKIILPKLKQLTLIDLPMLYRESATFDIECPSLEELSLCLCPYLSVSV